jgi:starvation-inducible outer membrane lipoprotein
MMRYLFVLTLAACGPVPVQISKQAQEQTQTASQTASQAADQQSAHQSESKQGTNSMPVIVVCVQNNSAASNCATPQKDGPVAETLMRKMK